MQHVLIVDDSSEICGLLCAMVAGLGHSAECADSGRAALDLLRRQKFDLVLLDVCLNDIGGLDVLAALQETASIRGNPPVVVMTVAPEEAGERRAMLELGAVAYVDKMRLGLFELADLLNTRRMRAAA